MVKKILSANLFFLLFSFALRAQNIIGYQGLFRSSMTISPSFMTEHKLSNLYLHGFAELFPEKNISFRGDSYLFLGSQQKNDSLLNQNSHLLYGFAIHHTNGLNDFYCGIEPGVSYTQPGNELPAKICPTLSVFAGYTFSVWKYFNFYAGVRVLNTRYIDYIKSSSGILPLNEILFSAGLGFQIPLKKLCCPEF